VEAPTHVGTADAPAKIEFSVTAWGKEGTAAELKVWFTNVNAPDVALLLTCESPHEQMACTGGESAVWKQSVVTVTAAPEPGVYLTDGPPRLLRIKATAERKSGAPSEWKIFPIEVAAVPPPAGKAGPQVDKQIQK
jgi:hypothetical protein